MIGVSFARCAGWLHEANGGRGVILCSAHGLEELSARKSWKTLADRLAAAGMPTLRFDYDGTADAGGSSEEPGRVDAWRSSVRDAIRWLEVNLGVTEIVLIGLRTGALLAALEAEKHGNILGLGLLAPVRSGREYVCNLQDVARGVAPPDEGLAKPGTERPGIDVFGFRERPETIADVEALSLVDLERAPAREVLLLSQNGVVLAELREQLARLGCGVTDAEFPGYERMISDPIAARVPKAAIDRIVEWAVALAPMPPRRARAVRRQDLKGDGWIESGVCFGPGRTLAGVLCQPQDRHAVEPPVIFMNCDMSYHIGLGRMTVDHARALAAAGVPSLRIDSAGIGDSGTIFGLEEGPLYGDAAEASLICAVDWLEAHGFEAPTVVGGSNGAYAAFHGLRSDPRMKRAVLINLPCFHGSPSMRSERERGKSLRHAELTRSIARADTNDFFSSVAARALSAGASCTRLAGRAIKTALLHGGFHIGGDMRHDVRAWFEDFSERGCQVMMIYSAGNAGLSELQHWTGPMGSAVTRLPGISVRLIDNADHNLTSFEARAALLEHMTTFMGVRGAGIPSFSEARLSPMRRYDMAGSGI